MNTVSVCTVSTAESSEQWTWPMKHNIQESSNGLDGVSTGWLTDFIIINGTFWDVTSSSNSGHSLDWRLLRTKPENAYVYYLLYINTSWALSKAQSLPIYQMQTTDLPGCHWEQHLGLPSPLCHPLPGQPLSIGYPLCIRVSHYMWGNTVQCKLCTLRCLSWILTNLIMNYSVLPKYQERLSYRLEGSRITSCTSLYLLATIISQLWRVGRILHDYIIQ